MPGGISGASTSNGLGARDAVAGHSTGSSVGMAPVKVGFAVQPRMTYGQSYGSFNNSE